MDLLGLALLSVGAKPFPSPQPSCCIDVVMHHALRPKAPPHSPLICYTNFGMLQAKLHAASVDAPLPSLWSLLWWWHLKKKPMLKEKKNKRE